jgi:arylformamidase
MNSIRYWGMRMMLFGVLVAQTSCVFAARQIYKQVNDNRDEKSLQEASAPIDPAALPAGIRIVRDVAYGSDNLQRLDVYAPAQAKAAPVIFMVHGGGWAFGDKSARNVVENKVKRWVTRGFLVISVNNRLQPGTDPLGQAQDVAHALAAAQDKAATWGGDRNKFILMGHSAGAHLIALVSVSPQLAKQAGAAPWLGSVLLDSAALDVPQLMQLPHFDLYDRAFGKDSASWKAVSPIDLLSQAGPPILAVCSSQRRASCPQTTRFVAKATALGTRASVLREDLTHGEINQRLGADGPYTEAVEDFMRSLAPSVAALLVSTTSEKPRPSANAKP